MCGVLLTNVLELAGQTHIRGQDTRSIHQSEWLLEHSYTRLTTRPQSIQPLRAGKWRALHNGCISNADELRATHKLTPLGNGDSYVILELLQKFGWQTWWLKKLTGSFAIIALNVDTHQIYLARDFMPLSYWLDGERVAIGSLDSMLPPKSAKLPPYTTMEIVDGKIVKQIELRAPINKKVLVICSGGLDSTTVARFYSRIKYEVTLLHFSYGQRAEQAEAWAVNRLGRELGANVEVSNCKQVFGAFDSRLLKMHKKHVSVQHDTETTHSYVPLRNAIFAMIAAAYAEKHGIGTISYGGNQGDSAYPDNTPDFCELVDNLLPFAINRNANVQFRAPFINIGKYEIGAIARHLGCAADEIASCYYGKVEKNHLKVCNKCGPCHQLKEALSNNVVNFTDIWQKVINEI